MQVVFTTHNKGLKKGVLGHFWGTQFLTDLTSCAPKIQSWALSVFLSFPNNKKFFFAFFIMLI